MKVEPGQVRYVFNSMPVAARYGDLRGPGFDGGQMVVVTKVFEERNFVEFVDMTGSKWCTYKDVLENNSQLDV